AFLPGAVNGATMGTINGISPFAGPLQNPAGEFFPGASQRNSGSVGLELTDPRLKGSVKTEVRKDSVDTSFPGVVDRLHVLFNGDVALAFTEDVGAMARLHWA